MSCDLGVLISLIIQIPLPVEPYVLERWTLCNISYKVFINSLTETNYVSTFIKYLLDVFV